MAPATPDAQVALLNKLMREHIAPHLPPGMGATLLLFPQSTAPGATRGLVSYISSANRDDMREAMQELLDRWKARAAETPREMK